MKYLVIIFVSFIFFCCERLADTEIDLPFEGEEFTIYGLISENDSSYVAAFINKPVLDEFVDIETENALFSISNENSEVANVDLMSDTEDFFIFPFINNENYILDVTLSGETFTSEAISIPRKVEIDSINIIPYDNRNVIDVDVYFRDLPEVEFYSIFVERYNQGELLEERLKIPDLRSCIDDSEFKNATTVIKITEIGLSPFLSVVPPLSADSIEVNLYSISQEICEFSKAVTVESLPLNSVTDPEANIFSNINGARGIFAGFNRTSIGIKL